MTTRQCRDPEATGNYEPALDALTTVEGDRLGGADTAVVVLRLTSSSSTVDKTIANAQPPERVALLRLSFSSYLAAHPMAFGVRPSQPARKMEAPRGTASTRCSSPATAGARAARRPEVLAHRAIEGGPCVDFNCFNLHELQEYMHKPGRTRTLSTASSGKGLFCGPAPRRAPQ